MAPEFSRLGITVQFVVLEGKGDLMSSIEDSFSIRPLRAQRIRDSFGPLARYLGSQDAPDAMLADTWPLTTIALAAKEVARWSGRVVVAEHNTLSMTPLYAERRTRWAMRSSIACLYPRAHRRIAVSAGVADDLAEIGHIKRDRIDVVHNAAATGRTTPKRTADGELRLISVGSMKAQKDHAMLIRAFARVVRTRRATLTILGDGPLRAETERLVRRLGLQKRVFLPGFVNNVSEWYSAADVFVLSSAYEGFGNVIVEAMEHGLDVVSTDCRSGPREILCDGKLGHLVPVGDEVAMAEAILRAERFPTNQQRLKDRAADFRLDRVTRRYAELLFGAE